MLKNCSECNIAAEKMVCMLKCDDSPPYSPYFYCICKSCGKKTRNIEITYQEYDYMKDIIWDTLIDEWNNMN